MSIAGWLRKKFGGADGTRYVAHACLRCGAVIASAEDRRDHARMNLFGPNTCRRAAGQIGHGVKRRRGQRGRTIADVETKFAIPGRAARKSWRKVKQSGAIVQYAQRTDAERAVA